MIEAKPTFTADEHILHQLAEIEDGKLAIVDFIAQLKSGSESSTPEFMENFVALLWAQGSQGINGDVNRSKLFANLLKELINQSLLDLNTIKLNLEISTLIDTGVIRESEESHQKRLVKMNTSLVYRQQKYNLLREETEGYAKLVSIIAKLPRHAKHIENIIRNIQSLTGQFDLDPNRVLDIVLDCFEQQPDNLSFIEILKIFRVPNIVHILGFKFLQYHPVVEAAASSNPTAAAPPPPPVTSSSLSSTTAEERRNPSQPPPQQQQQQQQQQRATPSSLYRVAAALIMFDLVNLSEFLPYLSPSLEQTIDELKSEEARFVASIVNNTFTKDYSGPQFMTKELKYRLGSSFSVASNSAEVPLLSLETAETDSIKQNSGGFGEKPPPPSSAPPSSSATASVNANEIKSSSTNSNSNAKPPPPSYPPPKSIVTTTTKEKASESFDVLQYDLFSSKNEATNKVNSNQFLGTINALIQYRGWMEAKILLDVIWSNGVSRDFFLIYCPEIRLSLANLLSYSLQSLYKQSARLSIPVKSNRRRNQPSEQRTMDIQTAKSQYTVISSLQDFPEASEEIIHLLGYHLAEHNGTFIQICKVLKLFLESQLPSFISSDSPAAPRDLPKSLQQSLSIALVLLHGLSVSGADSTYFSHQVWQALKLYPFSVRFSLYDSWRQSSTLSKSIPPVDERKPTAPSNADVLYGLSLAEKYAFNSFRRELKRLAKDNTKTVGRNVAKYLHANPLSAIIHILNQIEAFDNLIPHVIEALKYSLDLSRDVFASQILLQLKKFDNDNKLKSAGQSTHYAQWFVALSKFIGTFYCRYPATELTGLLHYLLESLGNQNQSADLLIIKDLLGIMGGSDTLTNVSNSQLEGLSGGKTLRGEVMGNTTSIKSGLSVSSKKSSSILREELIKSNTALPLLLFVAQLRRHLLFDSEMRHLKLVSHLYDVGQDLLIQFTDFLVFEAKSLESIATMMPSIDELMNQVGLSIPIIFQLIRPLSRAALQASSQPSSASVPAYLLPWHPFSTEIQLKLPLLLQSLHSDRSDEEEHKYSSITKELFILFWTLNLYDIYVPTERYQSENKRIKDKFTELDNKKESQSSLNMSSSEYAKYCKTRDVDMKNMMVIMTSLQEELNLQKRHVEMMKEVLSEQKPSLFPAFSSISPSSPPSEEVELSATNENKQDEEMSNTMDQLLQDLVYNRILMSPIDSIYCSKFAKLLHELAVPGFSIFEFYHKFLEYFLPLIFSCTECEASFIGYAIDDILTVVHRWQQSQSLFQLEGLHYRSSNSKGEGNSNGFMEALQAGVCIESLAHRLGVISAVPPASSSVSASVALSHYFQLFKDISKRWHSMLYVSIIAAINGKEYMYIRSAFVLLAKISTHFPYYRKEGNAVLGRVEQFIQEESREDLQIMARSLLIPLKKSQSNWINDIPLSPSGAASSKSIGGKGHQSFTALTENYSKTAREKERETEKPKEKREQPASSSLHRSESGQSISYEKKAPPPSAQQNDHITTSSTASTNNKRKSSSSNLHDTVVPPPKYARKESDNQDLAETSRDHDRLRDSREKEKEREKERDNRDKDRDRTERDNPPSKEKEKDKEVKEKDRSNNTNQAAGNSNSKLIPTSSGREVPKLYTDSKADHRSNVLSQGSVGGIKRSREDDQHIPQRTGNADRARSRSHDRDHYHRGDNSSNRSGPSSQPSSINPPVSTSDRFKRSDTDSALNRVNSTSVSRNNSATPRTYDDNKDRSRPPPPPLMPPVRGGASSSSTSGVLSGRDSNHQHHSYEERGGGRGNAAGGGNTSSRGDFRPPPPPSIPPTSSSTRDQDSQFYNKKQRR